MVVYGEHNLCDDETGLQNGTVVPYTYSTCFGNILALFLSLVFISQVVALFSGNM